MCLDWNCNIAASVCRNLKFQFPMTRNLHLHVELPEDIIVNNILCRLPVKFLHRFRCVSKRWRCIISDPEFAKSHFKMSSEQGTLCPRLLVTLTSQFGSFDFETTSFGNESLVRTLTFPILSKYDRPYLLGSCSGFVFIAVNDNQDLYLWNPSTRFVRRIPNTDLLTKFRFPRRVHISIYGMGYVSATDDYKIFVAGCEAGKINYLDLESWEPKLDHMEVFSLRSNCWKSIEAPEPKFKVSGGLGALSNEALHWDYHKNGEEQSIVAFDLAREEFRWVPLPVLGEDDDNDIVNSHNNNYGVKFACLETHVFSGGCLGVSFVRGPSGDPSKHFWVMREYGVRQSWTMLFKFREVDRPSFCCPNPIFVTESGTLVLKREINCRNELVRIEGLKEGKVVINDRYNLRQIEWPGVMLDMILYHETLLSVPEGQMC